MDALALDRRRDHVSVDRGLVLPGFDGEEAAGLVRDLQQFIAQAARLLSRLRREWHKQLPERFDLSYRTLEDRDISLVVERLPFEPADYVPLWEEIASGNECNEITMRFRLTTVPAGIPLQPIPVEVSAKVPQIKAFVYG